MRKFCCFVRYAPQPELGLCLRKPDLRIPWPKRWQLDGHCRNVLCGAQVRCRRRADQVWKGEPGESRAVEAGVRLGKEVARLNSSSGLSGSPLVAFCFGSQPQNSATNRKIPVP